MLPDAPKASAGEEGRQKYRDLLEIYSLSLRNKMDREFFRKDVRARAKFYSTLSKQRPKESNAAIHFTALYHIHREVLEAFGPEPKPKPRGSKAPTVPLSYPELSKEFTLRVHFLKNGSLRREKAAVLTRHADEVSQQKAKNGDVLLSVSVHPERVQFFERLIEALGADGLGPSPFKRGSFEGYIASDGVFVKKTGWDDLASPWRRMSDDNANARLFHWSLRRGQLDPSITLPEIPSIPGSLPWDPDERFNRILILTQQDSLNEADKILEEIDSCERDVLFDEVLYLRYLLNQTPKANDLRYLVNKYISSSSIRERLVEEYDEFIDCIDNVLSDTGPLPEGFPGLSSSIEMYEEVPNVVKRNPPPLGDWSATRRYYYKKYQEYGHPIKPRGRIFVWHPDIAAGSLSSLMDAFRPDFVAAENNFRRARSIAEIGRGWASETALVDLVRSKFPDAVHQWRPSFLGLQSIDIFIPSINLAIEYQGEQHFRAVSIYGGEEGYIATKARDDRKRLLLEANSVTLFEWPYYKPISRSELEATLECLS
ncbi:hypothetical protein [Emcibacter nanhaiensis]|uniref:Uncharacterized protein n=1 Tax=Emcibacter nanhaiensis TaxID=1505037 RepID=A0A501PFN6_9PROT|nr:hypothetical protein [Emcibacter nanhaiensis]TPD58995.1 hypothetical protein FIV46_12220 [Emcibacter nanhaiensis]